MLRKILFITLLFSGMASAQVYTSSAFQNSPGNYGRAVPFAQVTLCAASDTAVPCTQKVQTFTSDTLLTQCTLTAASGVLTGSPTSGTNCNNPGIADAQGNFTIYVAPGNYRICLYSQTWFCAEIQVGGGSSGAGTANCGNAVIGSIAGWSTPVTICFDPLSGTDFAGNLFFQGARALGSTTGFFGLTGALTDPTLSDLNTVYDLAPLSTSFTSYGNRRASSQGTAGQFPYIVSQATINGLPVNTLGWSNGTGVTSLTATSPVVATPSTITNTGAFSCPTCKIKTCIITTGDPGSASPVLANDNDAPAQCGNDLGTDITITAVACYADAGSPTVTPILTGGSGTSILTGALTCGAASWAAGTVNGSPVIHSFSANGATCSSTPCTVDGNITTAGGTAKYIVMKITGTY